MSNEYAYNTNECEICGAYISQPPIKLIGGYPCRLCIKHQREWAELLRFGNGKKEFEKYCIARSEYMSMEYTGSVHVLTARIWLAEEAQMYAIAKAWIGQRRESHLEERKVEDE